MATRQRLLATAVALLAVASTGGAFRVPRPVRQSHLARPGRSATVLSAVDGLKPIEKMRAREMQEELASRGVSSAGLFDREMLSEALARARLDRPIGFKSKVSSSSSSSSAGSSRRKTSFDGGKAWSRPSADGVIEVAVETEADKIADELGDAEQPSMEMQLAAVRRMRAGAIREELVRRKVPTTGLLEKEEFVAALAKARAEGKGDDEFDEPYDPDYRDVKVTKMARKRESDVDDQQKQRQQRQSRNAGGMGGGMGGLGDILGGMMGGGAGGMGGMGGMGGSPFDMMGGMGGMGGGMGGMGGMQDLLGKVMNNPKARDALAKAQSNPRIMAKVQECISNPAKMAQYQNDPELKEILDALKGVM